MASDRFDRETEQPFWFSRGFAVTQLGLGIAFLSVVVQSELVARVGVGIAVVGFAVLMYDYALPRLREVIA